MIGLVHGAILSVGDGPFMAALSALVVFRPHLSTATGAVPVTGRIAGQDEVAIDHMVVRNCVARVAAAFRTRECQYAAQVTGS